MLNFQFALRADLEIGAQLVSTRGELRATVRDENGQRVVTHELTTPDGTSWVRMAYDNPAAMISLVRYSRSLPAGVEESNDASDHAKWLAELM